MYGIFSGSSPEAPLYFSGDIMSRISILKECCQIIDNHCEEDFECGGAGYHLSFVNGKIKFHRVTSCPTGETYGDGGIDTKLHSSVICDWDATLEDYCNLAISVANSGENIEYDFGENAKLIRFKGIY